MTEIINIRADVTAGQIVNGNNQTGKAAAPRLVLGVDTTLTLILWTAEGAMLPAAVADFFAWYFVLADDWDVATAPLVTIANGITAGGVSQAEVVVGLSGAETECLSVFLDGADERKLGAELIGFISGNEVAQMVLQFEIIVRNRRTLGEENEVE